MLNAALRRLLAKKNPSLFQRLSEAFTIMAKQAAPPSAHAKYALSRFASRQAARYAKEKGKRRQPFPGYKIHTVLASDMGGHVLLDHFLQMCHEVFVAPLPSLLLPSLRLLLLLSAPLLPSQPRTVLPLPCPSLSLPHLRT